MFPFQLCERDTTKSVITIKQISLSFARASHVTKHRTEDHTVPEKVISRFDLSCSAGQNIAPTCHVGSSVNTGTADTHMMISHLSQLHRFKIMQ